MDTNDAYQHRLRQSATALAQDRFARPAQSDDSLSREQLLQALHELRVHQIELEMQNEELRRMQAQLDDERASYFDLYELAPVGYLSLSDSGSILKANLTIANLLNVDRRTLINKPVSRFILKEDQASYYRHLKQLMDSGLTQSCELRMVNHEGHSFWARIEASISQSDTGTTQHRVLLADISDAIRLQQSVQEKNAELDSAVKTADKANQAKSEFLARMSHELRSPLNAILGFSQLMAAATTPAPTPSQKNRIEHILKSGWYLLDLITDILDLSLIESGNFSLVLEAICLFDISSDCSNMVQPEAEKNQVHLSFGELDRQCFVMADRVRLTQLFVNLLSNAIKYNRVGGTVDVSFSVASTGTLHIEVRDSGEGLSEDKLSHLFQPFNRLGQEHGVIDGTGIGLVVSKRLVEMMGGAIGVESIVGVGSVFWIELSIVAAPVAAAAQKPALAQQVAQQVDNRNRSVLYVEDDPDNMELVRQMLLLRPDLNLLCAPDAATGLSMARSYVPDVILMDLGLPDMSGLEVLQILHTDPRTQRIPVLAVSANAMPVGIRNGLDSGFLRYLTKPFRLDELMEAIDLAFEVTRLQAITGMFSSRPSAGERVPS